MTDCTLETSPVDWILDHPETAPLLDELGIDCSCAGKSLAFACRREGLDPDWVLRRLHESLKPSRPDMETKGPRAADG